MSIKILLSEYGVSWFSSEVKHRQLGFLPLRNEILDRLSLPKKYREILKLLNSNSKISFQHMASEIGMHFNSAEYNLEKLIKGGYIRRFTITMQNVNDVSFMSFICKYNIGMEHESNSARARKAFMYDDKDPLVSRYIICAQLIGSYDFFNIGAFDDPKVAYKNGVLYHKACHSGIKMKYAIIDKVILGRLAINSLDTKSEYKTIKWEL